METPCHHGVFSLTTFHSWVQSTYSMIKHLPRGHKYDLKRAQGPVVRGFREASPQRQKSPSSDIRLYSLRNRTAHEHVAERATGAAPAATRTANRVMTSPSAVSNPTKTDGNRSWLHDHWKPGQARAGIDFFERLGSASAQGTSARSSSPNPSISVKRPAPAAPAQPEPTLVSRHGKTKRAPLPPQPVPVQAKIPTALRGPDSSKPVSQPQPQTTAQPPVTKAVTPAATTFAPPPAPPMDGLKALQRANSAPPLSPPNMAAVFAELKGHKLVQRSDSAPETIGKGGGRNVMESKFSRQKLPLNAFQLELKKKTFSREVGPIKVRPEVQEQAEALRARLEAERSANQSVSPRRSVDSVLTKTEAQRTYLPNGRLAPNTEQKRLIDELKAAQAVHSLKTAGAHGS